MRPYIVFAVLLLTTSPAVFGGETESKPPAKKLPKPGSVITDGIGR
jgi:hypothetical protein